MSRHALPGGGSVLGIVFFLPCYIYEEIMAWKTLSFVWQGCSLPATCLLLTYTAQSASVRSARLKESGVYLSSLICPTCGRSNAFILHVNLCKFIVDMPKAYKRPWGRGEWRKGRFPAFTDSWRSHDMGESPPPWPPPCHYAGFMKGPGDKLLGINTICIHMHKQIQLKSLLIVSLHLEHEKS